MRVIAGTYRSRILKSLKGTALRPTSDRLRETLFNVLGAGVADSRFLDIFAGTGAIGIEAISRGASNVTFIENHAPAAAIIRRNLESLEIKKGIEVLAVDALRGLETLAVKQAKPNAKAFDYIFLDPPYAAAADYDRVLRFLGSSNLFGPETIVIAEHHRKFDLPEFFGKLQRVRILRQSDAALTFFRQKLPPAEGDPETEKS
jgi:16S rRNA (guanine(966)-N(2))-methyltransferase RsmD